MLVANAVQAQSTPPPSAPPGPGTTERPTLVAPELPQHITASISAGSTLNGGNTKSYAATLGGRFQLVHKPHQFTIEGLGTYIASRNAADGNKIDPTAMNAVGRARYDIFLTKNDALFAALAPRTDRFAGIDFRLQTQAGYLRNLYKPADNHRLWIEAGYDGTYDNLTPWLPPGTPKPEVKPDIKKHEFIHSVRGFVGYTNMLTPLATINVGMELLYDLQDKKNTRVNSSAELTSSLTTRFKLSLLSRILYDHKPVPGKTKADYITTAQIVFTYDSVKPPPTCAACDCSDEVAVAKRSCKQDATVSPGDMYPPPSAYIPSEEPAGPAPIQPQPASAQPAPAKPAP
jgi:putative salt-induced outer membrane protein YdiY